MTSSSPFLQTTLKNGLTVLSKNIPTVETISFALRVPVGSRYETPDEAGLSHMLEHMFFKGTTSRSAQKIAEEVEEYGAHFNAYTSRECTVFSIRALAEDLDPLLKILGDIIKNSTFDENELTKEREVILQEIAMTNDTPDDIIFDLAQEASFPGQAIGGSILGTVSKVSAYSQQDLLRFRQKYYDPSKMYLAISGKVDGKRFAELAEEEFSDLQPTTPITPNKAFYKGGQETHPRDLEQVHSILGFEGVPMASDYYYEAALLGTILGGGMSSRLFQKVREEKGLVYSIFAYHSAYVDTGFFGIYASMTPDNKDQVLDITHEELNRFSKTLTEEELNRARQQLKSSLMMGLESVSGQCEQLINQVRLYGRPLAPEEILEKINRVTLKDLASRATSIFSTPKTLVQLGPI